MTVTEFKWTVANGKWALVEYVLTRNADGSLSDMPLAEYDAQTKEVSNG